MSDNDKDSVFEQAFGNDKKVTTTKKPDSEIDVDNEEIKTDKAETDGSELDEEAVLQQLEKDLKQDLIDEEVIEEEIKQDVDEDVEEDELRNDNSKLIKAMLGVTVLSLAVGGAGLFTAIHAMGNANSLQAANKINATQISSLKTEVATTKQSNAYNTDVINELKAGMEHAHASNIESEEKLAHALTEISKLQNYQVKQNTLNSDFELSLAKVKSSVNDATHMADKLEKKLSKQINTIKHSQPVATTSNAPTTRSSAGTASHTMRHYKSHKNVVEPITEFNGIRLSSIDGWDGAYSATLTTPDNAFKIVNPGYLVNGYRVKQITAHKLFLVSPSGANLVMEQ